MNPNGEGEELLIGFSTPLECAANNRSGVALRRSQRTSHRFDTKILQHLLERVPVLGILIDDQMRSFQTKTIDGVSEPAGHLFDLTMMDVLVGIRDWAGSDPMREISAKWS